MSITPAFASATDAAKTARAALGFLAAVHPMQLVTGEQAQCLQILEQVTSMGTAARASVLGAFIAGQGYAADADYSPRSWLIHRTRITKGAATAHTVWARRAAAHPQVAAALAEGDMSESYARTVCEWSDKIPEDCRPAADAILIAAAQAGAALEDLAGLAGEIYARSLADTADEGPLDDSFEDRLLRLETTFDGAGVLAGDLTPECAAVVTAVLDALFAPVGAQDTRSHGQRYHDGLAEAMRRLIAAGLLPERAGQPVRASVHVSLAELRAMDCDSALEGRWIAAARARWAAQRAAASVGGGDGAAWLDGDAAGAVACDAILTPIVSGDVDIDALEDLVRLCVELGRLDHAGGTGEPGTASTPDAPGAGPTAPVSPSREALERAIIGKAADLLSGPGGLASFLRRQELGARLAGPSLPLDVGYSQNVPAAIRAAVIARDRRCRWAGGCHQPASACEVHHTRHKSRGGKTSTTDCVLLCWFHHQVVIHRWGWTLVLNPDGTTTAWNLDRTKDLARLSSIRRSETQDRSSGQAKVRWSPMSVIVRGKNANRPYTVRFWADGQQRERSFRTRKEADDFKIKTDHDIRAQIFVDDRRGKEKFSEAARAWLDRKAIAEGTKSNYRSILDAHIHPAIGERTLSSAANDREAVQDLLTKTMAHLSYSRRKMARLIILGVLDEAVIAGKIPGHRIKGIELLNGGSKKDLSDFIFPAHDQLTELAAGLGARGLTIWLMRGCGLRIQEALAVQTSCFRDGGRTLRVYEQARRDGHGTMALKHRRLGQYRDIPVPSYLWAMVKDLPDGYLFRTDDVFSRYNGYFDMFKRLARKAGIPGGFTPHSLRHAFVSALLARGVPITDVARWVGHKDINVTYAIYGHLVPNAADRAVSVLDAEYAEWCAARAGDTGIVPVTSSAWTSRIEGR